MKEKFLLILMDEEVILHQGLSKKTYLLKDKIKEIQGELKKFMELSPQIPLYVLLDRSLQEVREEILPPLWLWDRWRLLYHKKQHWRSQKEVYGYRFFKQGTKLYLQWISISQKDPLQDWFSWVHSLPHPCLGVYFVSLEAGVFLQKHITSQEGYGMLIYALSATKTRHVIFQGKRLLFSRPFTGEEDLKSSLHFLSRTYPEIHERIQIFNLNPTILLPIPENSTALDSFEFLHFLRNKKPSTLSLYLNPLHHRPWLKRTALIISLFSLCLSGWLIHQGTQDKHDTHKEVANIALLKTQLGKQTDLLSPNERNKKKSAIANYLKLRSQTKDPFLILKKLSLLLENQPVKLEKFIWEEGRHLEMVFAFPNQGGKKPFFPFQRPPHLFPSYLPPR